MQYVKEYKYLRLTMTNEAIHEIEINYIISKGRAAISKLNSVLWD